MSLWVTLLLLLLLLLPYLLLLLLYCNYSYYHPDYLCSITFAFEASLDPCSAVCTRTHYNYNIIVAVGFVPSQITMFSVAEEVLKSEFFLNIYYSKMIQYKQCKNTCTFFLTLVNVRSIAGTILYM